MTTRLRDGARLTREVEYVDSRSGESVVMVITITREGVYARERGRRTTYGPVAWPRVVWEAAKATPGMPSVPGARPQSARSRTERRNLLAVSAND